MNAFTEAVEKQNTIYLKWFQENYHELYSYVQDDDKATQIRELYEELCKARTQRYQEEPRYVNIPKIPENKRPTPTDLSVMKKVPSQVMAVLYKKEEGRKDYLKIRNKLDPIDKYYSILTTSWQYGWYLCKMKPPEKSCFGRKTIIKSSFYRPNGIGPKYFSGKGKPPLTNAPFIIHGI